MISLLCLMKARLKKIRGLWGGIFRKVDAGSKWGIKGVLFSLLCIDTACLLLEKKFSVEKCGTVAGDKMCAIYLSHWSARGVQNNWKHQQHKALTASFCCASSATLLVSYGWKNVASTAASHADCINAAVRGRGAAASLWGLSMVLPGTEMGNKPLSHLCRRGCSLLEAAAPPPDGSSVWVLILRKVYEVTTLPPSTPTHDICSLSGTARHTIPVTSCCSAWNSPPHPFSEPKGAAGGGCPRRQWWAAGVRGTRGAGRQLCWLPSHPATLRSAPEMLARCLLPMESRVRLRVWMSSGGYQVGTCAHGDGFAGFGHLRASEHVLRTLRMADEVLEVLGARWFLFTCLYVCTHMHALQTDPHVKSCLRLSRRESGSCKFSRSMF